MAAQYARALGTAVFGPVRWAQRTGYSRSALIRKAVDKRGEPRPWYCIGAIEFLELMDFSSDCILEFGSGQSTLWWGRRARRVVSYESDSSWYHDIAKATSKLLNTEVYYQSDLSAFATEPLKYGRMFDVVIIDGGDRAMCATTAIEVLKQDGIIILDNSEGNWGAPGSYPILDLLDQNDYFRIDFIGYAPGVLSSSVTSLFLRDTQRLRHLPPPPKGGK